MKSFTIPYSDTREVTTYKGTLHLPVRLGLQVEQLGVDGVQGHQIHVGAGFDDVAIVQHEDAVGQPHRAEAVASPAIYTV